MSIGVRGAVGQTFLSKLLREIGNSAMLQPRGWSAKLTCSLRKRAKTDEPLNKDWFVFLIGLKLITNIY